MPQSAFIVRVAEAEPHVSHWREQLDPSARLGVPAHITLLFPFMSPERVDSSVVRMVSGLAASTNPFSMALGRLARFPGVLYLAPEPAAPLVALTKGLVALFPQFPPYGGEHSEVIPHLTVARAGEPELSRVEAIIRTSLGGSALACTCSEFALIENSSGTWRPMHTFSLGHSLSADG
jgi:2'-5' RNA ligase